jgi:glycosyltransferase involved in cell wall biosynthesis
MFRNWIYYQLKPVVPVSARMAIRRWFARQKRAHVSRIWPILPGSERPPENWAGWPDRKKFAFVLTHDVEGPIGVARCRQLMELEKDLGFRSSFNFIPQGDYRVSRDLRDELTRNGFEVGVHDFNHDGKLYQNSRVFADKARQINRYIREWRARGFRSGFMFHRLEWLHQLEVAYDASTFDTDPFEPQPDEVGTIFPFWVPRANADQRSWMTDDALSVSDVHHSAARGDGYVELPYTLPQDSTLFLLLREQTPEIWFKKLAWIAEHGGMALVNVHPDYTAFSDRSVEMPRAYPVELYKQLLEHVRSRYAGQYWHALPQELATFIADLKPLRINRQQRRVAMITHSVYTSDNRVRRYAQALAERGDYVEVFGLRPPRGCQEREVIDGVQVFQIQDRFRKDARSKLGYLWPLVRFFVAASVRITQHHLRRPYHLIHVHNIPDFLVFSAWYPKLTGTPVILDIHDIVPEFFASKFRTRADGLTNRLLLRMERASARFADRVIIANDLWREKYANRTGVNGRCIALINYVDLTTFTPQSRKVRDKQIIVYPGGLQWHQGVDIALRAFQKASGELPTAEFHIYGDGSAKPALIKLAEELGFNGKVRFFEPISAVEIARVMADADLGVVPKRADTFGNEAYSTKIMEFMAAGTPVIVSDTKVDRFYFGESVVRFFHSEDVDDLARQMIEVLHNRELSRSMVARAAEHAAHNSWGERKADYLALVDSLCQ